MTPQVPGSFLVGFVPDLTLTLLLPPALRPSVQNSSETPPEGQDTVTWMSPCQHRGPPRLPPSPPSACRGSPKPRITELFCVALEDLGDSFSFLSFELPWRSIRWSSGARPWTWEEAVAEPLAREMALRPTGAKLCYERCVQHSLGVTPARDANHAWQWLCTCPLCCLHLPP